MANELTREVSEIVEADGFAGRRDVHLTILQQSLSRGDAALDDKGSYGRPSYLTEFRRKVAGGVPDGLGHIAQTDAMNVILLDERMNPLAKRRIVLLRGRVGAACGGVHG